MNQLFATYFEAVAVWFESLAIGVTGGEVWKNVKEVIGSYEEFGIALNPGHLIHTEEWTNSPFVENGTARLKSGMMIQCDFTARPASCMGLGVHTEDGLVLADGEIRKEIQRLAPDSYERMIKRQKFKMCIRDSLLYGSSKELAANDSGLGFVEIRCFFFAIKERSKAAMRNLINITS